MLIDLANVLGHRIANSIDLIDKPEAAKAVGGALDAARELLGASKAEVYHVRPSEEQRTPENVLARFACSPSYPGDYEKPTYSRSPRYSVKRQKGVWNYVYDTKIPIWVIGPNQDPSKVPDKNSTSTQTAYSKSLHNCIPGMPDIPAMYNFADKNSETVITFPFTKKIEEGETCWGILNLEFIKKVKFSEDQYKALEQLRDHISNIVWKQRFWERTKSETGIVVDDFHEWCQKLSSASLSWKTGLLIKDDDFEQELYCNLTKWFADNFIQMDEYDLKAKSAKFDQTRNLDIQHVIKKEHFGIVDVTRYDQKPDLLFFLGLFAMERRPCLVLSGNINSREPIPDFVRSIARKVIKIDDQPKEPGEPLFHVYKYNIVDKDIVFFGESAEVDQKNPLQTFLNSVRRQSKAFRYARDYGPGT